MVFNPLDEANKTIRCLQDQVERLEAKVQRLQQSKLDKFAAQAMQGLLSNSHDYCVIMIPDKIARHSVNCAKALIAELNKEGEK